MEIQPYLFFNGRCEEAIEFYRQALGARVEMMMRMNESPDGPPPDLPPGWEKKIMHACFRVEGVPILASDGMGPAEPVFQGFSLAISVADVATVDRLFDGLSAGGQVRMPLGQTFWSPRFGVVTDRFGVGWMVMATA
jgi:PhnB protein